MTKLQYITQIKYFLSLLNEKIDYHFFMQEWTMFRLDNNVLCNKIDKETCTKYYDELCKYMNKIIAMTTEEIKHCNSLEQFLTTKNKMRTKKEVFTEFTADIYNDLTNKKKKQVIIWTIPYKHVEDFKINITIPEFIKAHYNFVVNKKRDLIGGEYYEVKGFTLYNIIGETYKDKDGIDDYILQFADYNRIKVVNLFKTTDPMDIIKYINDFSDTHLMIDHFFNNQNKKNYNNLDFATAII